TSRTYGLVAEGKAGGCQPVHGSRGRGSRELACPGEAHLLRAATDIVRDADRGRKAATEQRRERHSDRAAGEGRQRPAAGVGLGKVLGIRARNRNAGDAQGGVARVVQGDGLRRAGLVYGLAAEGKAGG